MSDTKNTILQKFEEMEHAPLNYSLLTVQSIKKSDPNTSKRSSSIIHQTESYELFSSKKPISKIVPLD